MNQYERTGEGLAILEENKCPLARRLAARQSHDEFGPPIDNTFHFNAAAQFLHNGLDDIKTDAAARNFGNGHVAGAIESLEQMW